MKKAKLLAVAVVVVCLATASCHKLGSGGPKMSGPLAFEPAKFADSIPEDYGPLVGVTQNSPGWVGLWFQKPDKTIVAVFVNIDEGKIYEKTLSIPRK